MIRRIKDYLRTHTKYGKSRYLNYLYQYDMKQFLEYSCMNKNNLEYIATEMRILSHAIEKGMSLPNCKERFGEEKVKSLIQLCTRYEKLENKADFQAIEISKKTVAAYYIYQKNRGINIDFIPQNFLENINLDDNLSGVIAIPQKKGTNFEEIARNRHSSRSYETTIEISDEIISKIVKIAQTAPSACNRQATHVYACKNQEVIKKIMEMHGGMRGFDIPGIIFAITGNLNLYQSEYERNTIFLDGGIFVMNLLYAIDSVGLVACPIIWGSEPTNDQRLSELLGISKKEKIVCLVTAGRCSGDYFMAACSPKRPIADILTIV